MEITIYGRAVIVKIVVVCKVPVHDDDDDDDDDGETGTLSQLWSSYYGYSLRQLNTLSTMYEMLSTSAGSSVSGCRFQWL